MMQLLPSVSLVRGELWRIQTRINWSPGAGRTLPVYASEAQTNMMITFDCSGLACSAAGGASLAGVVVYGTWEATVK